VDSATSPAEARPALGGEVYRGTLDCVHCGLCLPVCPTYRQTGSEVSSPRGRIFLMRGVAEGEISLGEALAEEAYLCLGCRACETACPSGVQFGRLIEATRAEVERVGLRRGWRKTVESLALRQLIPRPRRLRLAIDLLRLVQCLRLDRLARPLLPRGLRETLDLVPRIPSRREREPLPELLPAQPPRRGRVGLFVGCVMPELFGAVNHATARVLARNGFDVVVAGGQGCCGALHAHAGDLQFARRLARRNLAAFRAAALDAVVVNSAGCGAALREAHHWLPDEAEPFARSVRDVCQWLDETGLRAPSGRVEARVCYDDACHLIHGQGVREAPRLLLRRIPGVRLVEHDDSTSCCGAAGIYNLTHREISRAVLEAKMRQVAATDPDVVATGNPGCLLQLRVGAAGLGLRAQILHPLELLDASYRIEAGQG
jgi:glycolate oxidase iron-sulfur subunit